MMKRPFIRLRREVMVTDRDRGRSRRHADARRLLIIISTESRVPDIRRESASRIGTANTNGVDVSLSSLRRGTKKLRRHRRDTGVVMRRSITATRGAGPRVHRAGREVDQTTGAGALR